MEVIPTFLIDEPVLVSIGLLAAYFIPRGWNRSPLQTRAFAAGSLVTLGFMGMALYGYIKQPDWMFMYLLPAAAVPLWVVVYAFGIYYLLFVLGFLLSVALQQWRYWLPHLALALGAATSILVILPLRKAYQTVASYEEFHRGGGIPLPDSEMGRHMPLPTLALLVLGVLLFLWARRQVPEQAPRDGRKTDRA